jgi:hypothetical protein
VMQCSHDTVELRMCRQCVKFCDKIFWVHKIKFSYFFHWSFQAKKKCTGKGGTLNSDSNVCIITKKESGNEQDVSGFHMKQ